MRVWSGLLLLLPLAEAASTVGGRGSTRGAVKKQDDIEQELEIDLSCTLSHSSNENDCFQTSGCVWCQGAPLHGICVSHGQADALIRKLPGVVCTDPPSAPAVPGTQSEHDSLLQVRGPYNVACLTAGMNTNGGDDAAQEACDAATDENGNPCVWCDGAGVFGLCLNKEQSQQVNSYLQCDSVTAASNIGTAADTTQQTLDRSMWKNPLDPSCVEAAWNADDAQATCDNTADQDGNPCVWCSMPGEPAGICLNSDQANAAGQYISCASKHRGSDTLQTNDHHDKKDLTDNPYDLTCAIAGYTAGDQGETVCKATQDQDGDACVWCSMSGQGLCLTEEQSQIAQQISLDCDAGNSIAAVEPIPAVHSVAVKGSPYDITCALAGFTAGADGESVCASTVDQDGQPCVWCATGNLCLTGDQIDIAQQAGVQCGSKMVGNPVDFTCTMAAYAAGSEAEATCKSSKDTDGDDCVWCTAYGKGICMTDYQASVAVKWNVQCEEASPQLATLSKPVLPSEPVKGSPYDVTCALAGFTAGADGESVCASTVDQDGQPCVWCATGNLCLTGDQVDIAQQAGVQCGSKDLTDNPYDLTCAIAGYTAGDQGETVCKATQDQDGDACVWCSMSGQGLCLTEEQSQIAQQISLDCDAGNSIAAVEPITAIHAVAVKGSPYDITCALAGFTAGADGESVCASTVDQDGQPCVWCATGNLCLTGDQVDIAQQAGVQCGSKDLTDNPYDLTCAIAGYTAGDQGETVCKATQDQDGDACVWCSMSGQGLCLTEEQSQIAQQISLDCDASTAVQGIAQSSSDILRLSEINAAKLSTE